MRNVHLPRRRFLALGGTLPVAPERLGSMSIHDISKDH
jgi:hypothetical protein